MTQNFPYATYLDIRYPPLEVVDVPAIVDAVRDSGTIRRFARSTIRSFGSV